MKVLIVTVPVMAISSPPPILSILASCCEQVNVGYDVFDLNLYMHKTLNQGQVNSLNADFAFNQFESELNQELYTTVCQGLVNKINQYSPDLIAISVFTMHSLLATAHLLKILKKHSLRNNFKIVIGGLGVSNHFTPITGDNEFGVWAQNQQLVEHCITGEGEFSFPELLKGNTDYPGIDGIPNIQILDLDVLPTPSYKKIDPLDYIIDTDPELNITGSKGCVRDCTFCNVAHYWEKYTYRNGNLIADDIYSIYKETGVRNFNFTDSLINGSLKSFRQLNRRLIELNQKDPDFKIFYTGQFICRPVGQMTDQDYIEMKLAGAKVLGVGVEHFSQSVRNHMRKYFDNDAIDWHFAKCAELGIDNILLLVSGYVCETIEDHLINLEYLHRYQKYALTKTIVEVSVVPGGLALDPTATIFNMREELDLTLIQDQMWQWTAGVNPSLTPAERLRRSTETLYIAAKLKYQIAALGSTMAMLRRMVNESKQSKIKKVFPISVLD